LLLLWGFSAIITPLKFLGTSLLVGFEAFKMLFKLSLLSLVVQILGVFFFVKVFDFAYVILALIIADFIEIGIMWLFMIPRYRSKMLNKEALSA
jgi:O-antigen/teichoic acid export membrane protein